MCTRWRIALPQAAVPARVVMGQEPPKIPILDVNGVAVGEQAVDDEALKTGRMLWLTGQNTSIGQWDAAKLDTSTEVINRCVRHVAAQTRTPVHYIVGELSNVNGETLLAGETGLVKKVEEFQLFAAPPDPVAALNAAGLVQPGRVYHWSDGFARHPRCACVHRVLTQRQQRDALATVKDNPYTYFHSLSQPEQNRHFGAEQATAIRSGAQISETVNADRHMWRSRYTPKRGPGELPHSIVETVMREAKSDRAAAVAQFQRYGLLDESGHRRVSATERGKRFAEASPTETRTGAQTARNTQTASGGNNARMGSGSGGGVKPPSLGGASSGPDRWFAHNLDGTTKRERDAITRYTGGDFRRINRWLRAKTRRSDPQVESWVRLLDSALARNPTIGNLRLQRVVGAKAFGLHVAADIEAMAGRLRSEQGFLSTYRPGGGAKFFRAEPVLLDVLVPADTPGVYVESLSKFEGQHEVILGRHRRYMLINPRYDDRLGVWRAEMVLDPEVA